jgi:protein O-GlcNAc transferase
MSSSNATQSPPLAREDGMALIALFNAGRHVELENKARALTQRHPDSGFVWKVLGTALLVQGKDGLHALQQAVALLPGDAEALSNLGNVQKAQGLLGDAILSYQRALELQPGFAAGHYNLGIALKESQRLEEALAAYRQALALQPAFAEAHYNLGLALFELGRLQEAEAAYRAALKLQPRYLEALSNLGVVLSAQKRFEESLAVNQKAIGLQPNLAKAHNNQGNVLKELLRYGEAEKALKRAFQLEPDSAETCLNMGNLLKEVGRLDEAQAQYQRAVSLDPTDMEVFSNLLMTANYLPQPQVGELLALSRSYGDAVQRLAQPYTAWPNTPEMDRPIRVGLVSGDLRQHPVGYFLDSVLPALTAHAAGRIELYGYATQAESDAFTQRIQACCAGWLCVTGLSDQAMAAQIREDGIDILIDLAGHTAHNRLPVFAWKPAPVQVSWLGYFATTGVAAIDHLIADPWTLPANLDASFTEHIWRLPETRLCFTPPEADVPVSVRPDSSAGHVTFACFNNLIKMNDEVVSLWAQVLQAVPGSKLLLKAQQLGSEAVRKQVKARFAQQGVAASRLMLEGASERASYLAAYHRVDIGLDPFPFTGGTTTVESLWMGVPVLTLAGHSMIARQGVGLMVNAGLPDWVATDKADYIAKAVAHAADKPALAALRAGLRQQVMASPVFDAPRFAGHFAAALSGMWQAWCDRAPAQA